MAPAVTIGKYSLVERLDERPHCSRWRAASVDSGNEVVMTLMTPALLGGADAIARFRQEARRTVDLISPFAALVLDEGVVEETGAPYVVTELLRGQSLADRLARTRLRARDVARYVMQLGEALSEAADRGIIHRDLRPENVTLVGDPDEEIAKIGDFGVASGAWAASIKAGQAYAAASPRASAYMSPELVRSPKHVDYRTDLWSLAVIAFECLAGRHPFESTGGTSATGTRRAFGIGRTQRPMPSMSGAMPTGFEEWFARATARDIRARFQSAAELAGSLHALCCKPETAVSRTAVTMPPKLLPGVAPSIQPALARPAPASPPFAGSPASAASPALAAASLATFSGSSPAAEAAPLARASAYPGTLVYAGSGLNLGAATSPAAVVASSEIGGPSALLPGLRRGELRRLLGAGILLGLGLVALVAMLTGPRMPQRVLVPTQVIHTLTPAAPR